MLTFSDVYEHLLDVFYQSGKDIGRSARTLQRAIDAAYKQLLSIHDWEYFRRTTSIVTSTTQTYTDVNYTAADNKITLSSGTWVTNVEYGSILMDGVRYRVVRKVSSTVVIISGGPTSNFTGDVSWQQFRYLLPIDVGDILQLMDNKFSLGIERLNVSDVWWFQNVINAETYPIGWNVFPSSLHPGRWELWLTGANSRITQFELLYQARAASLSFREKLSGATNGTVSISGSTATFSQSILGVSQVGTVLRVSGTAETPSNGHGRLKFNPTSGQYEEYLNPFTEEFLITSVDSATTASLSSSGTTVSGKGFQISPHIDVNSEGMEQLLFRMCEAEYDVITRSDPPVRKISQMAVQQALVLAMGADGARIEQPVRPIYSGTIIEE